MSYIKRNFNQSIVSVYSWQGDDCILLGNVYLDCNTWINGKLTWLQLIESSSFLSRLLCFSVIINCSTHIRCKNTHFFYHLQRKKMSQTSCLSACTGILDCAGTSQTSRTNAITSIDGLSLSLAFNEWLIKLQNNHSERKTKQLKNSQVLCNIY